MPRQPSQKDREKAALDLIMNASLQTYQNGAIYVWKKSSNVVPPWFFTENGLDMPEQQEAAHDEQQAKSIAEYKERMKDWEPDAEDLYEMRAAFGTGAEVVNVITGRKIQL
jgi:hypothetical protein